MRLIIKNKLISLGGDSVVTDENGKELYIVDGKVFTFSKRKIIKTMDNKVLFKIKNKVFFNFLHNRTYIYDKDGKKILTIKKHKWTYRNQFVDCQYNIEYNRKFMKGEAPIYINGEEAALFGTEFFTLKDTYYLDVYKEEFTDLLVAIVIAYDNIKDKHFDQND